MFETLKESKSTAVLENALDSLAGKDKAQVTKKQILSGGLADWTKQLKQLFPQEADELLGSVREFLTVEAQAAETPQFNSIESYLRYRDTNLGAMYACEPFHLKAELTNLQLIWHKDTSMALPRHRH
jgi:hypothetical protein